VVDHFSDLPRGRSIGEQWVIMSTVYVEPAHSCNSPEIRAVLGRLRKSDNRTNLRYLAGEYACIALVAGLTVGLVEARRSWGLAGWFDVPVFAVAIVLMGGLQHRLAGLGHEASHYTLLRNKRANDLVGDLFCLFPIMATIHFYRLFHLAHHQFTNDPDHDPDLVNLGPGKRVADFPMPGWMIVLTRLLAPLTAPVSFAVFQWEYAYVNALGKGNNVYMRRVVDGDAASPWPRPATILGIAYLVGFVILQNVLTRVGQAPWLIPAGVIGMGLVGVAVYSLPDQIFFRAPLRQPFSPKAASVLRLGFYTGVLVVLGLIRDLTGGRSATYVALLWLVPLMTTFPYFLLLRDTFQHTNADAGRLTNSRVFLTDPFTRWAVFVYGQDMHVPHHLFPSIPHYHLPELHRALKESDVEYAEQVVECEGTFHNTGDRPTILAVLSGPAPHQVAAPMGAVAVAADG